MINSLILSAELFWNVFSWSIPSKAILNQELLMSMAVHRRITLHRRHCKRVLHFQMCYLFMFFQDARKLHSLLFLFMFFGEQEGREGEAVRKKHLTFESFFLLQVLPQP